MIPGEREARVAEERARSIPIDATTVGLLKESAGVYGVPLPEAAATGTVTEA